MHQLSLTLKQPNPLTPSMTSLRANPSPLSYRNPFCSEQRFAAKKQQNNQTNPRKRFQVTQRCSGNHPKKVGRPKFKASCALKVLILSARKGSARFGSLTRYLIATSKSEESRKMENHKETMDDHHLFLGKSSFFSR